MEHEIVRADVRLRRRVLWWVALLAIGGLIGLVFLYRWLDGLADLPEDLSEARRQAVLGQVVRAARIAAWVAGACFVAGGAWLVAFGVRVRIARRYPPPGMRVIRDTRIRTGPEARDVATLATAAGLLLAALGSAATWYLLEMAMMALGR